VGVGAGIGVDLGTNVGWEYLASAWAERLRECFAANFGSDPKWARTNTPHGQSASAPHKPTPDNPQIHHDTRFRLGRLGFYSPEPSRGKSRHCAMLCEAAEGGLSSSRSRPAFSDRWSTEGTFSGPTFSVNPLRSALVDSNLLNGGDQPSAIVVETSVAKRECISANQRL